MTLQKLRLKSLINLVGLQFTTIYGVRFGDILISILILINFEKFIKYKINKIYIILFGIYIFYISFFLLFNSDINYQRFFNKSIMIIICLFTFILGQFYNESEILKISRNSISIVVMFASFQLFISHIFNPEWLKFFTCDVNRHQIFGLIRCGPFAEGSYFGSYLVLMSLLTNSTIIVIIALIGALISASPIPIIIIFLYLFYISNNKIRFILFFFTLSFLFFNTNYFLTIFSKLNFFDPNLFIIEGSTAERFDLIKSGFKIFLSNPIGGVLPGQFSDHLLHYATLEIFIKNPDNIHFIPNNVYAELLAEYGIFGLIFLLIFVFKILTAKRANLFASLSILITMMQMPTFFLPWNFLFLSFFLKKYS